MQIERICGAPAHAVPSSGGRSISRARFHVIAIFILVGVLFALALLWDHRSDAFFRAQRLAHPDWKGLCSVMTRYGDWPFLVLYAVAFFIAGVIKKSLRWKTLALAMGLACFLSGMTATAVRSVTGRTRPSASAPQGWYGLRNNSQWLVGNRDYNSFPSGHVAAGVGFVMPLILATRRGKAPSILFCAVLTWSRLYSSAHHLSDTLAGAVVGVVGGYCIWRWLMPRYIEPFLARESTAVGLPLVRETETLPAFD